MQLRLLDILACPRCRGELSCAVTEAGEDGEVHTGCLDCASCSRRYPITAGIPRFVDEANYASSFGLQWNRFRSAQLDSANGTSLSAKRFYAETGWTREWLGGRWVLDAGCGAGRFLDVASRSAAEVVGIDLSSAIDAARVNLGGRRNVHFVQASIYELPFRDAVFDACYCIGVIQHTPRPAEALRALPRVLKAGGQLAVTVYERKRWTPLYAKYLVRPLTRRLDERRLLRIIRALMPVLFPLTEVVFRLPYAGRLLRFAIPVANYVDEPDLSWRQRYTWAILDTFDMLSPRYDQPQTQQEVERALAGGGIRELRRLGNPGVNVVGRKSA